MIKDKKHKAEDGAECMSLAQPNNTGAMYGERNGKGCLCGVDGVGYTALTSIDTRIVIEIEIDRPHPERHARTAGARPRTSSRPVPEISF